MPVIFLIIAFVFIAGILNSMSNSTKNEETRKCVGELKDIFSENDEDELIFIKVDERSSNEQLHNDLSGSGMSGYGQPCEEMLSYETPAGESLRYEPPYGEGFTYEMTGNGAAGCEMFTYEMSGNEATDKREPDYSEAEAAFGNSIAESSLEKEEIGMNLPISGENVLKGIILSEILQPPKARKLVR